MQSNNGLSELIVEQKEGRISRISASSSLIVSRAFSDKMSRTATFLLALLASAARAAPLIEGLVAPTFTPLGANGTSFDAAAVDGLARWAGNGTGVHWVYLTGSTGESVDLTTAERKAAVEAWAVAAPKYGLRVVVHVGSDSVNTARDLAAHAEAHGASAIAAMPPTYIRPGSVGAYVETMAYIAAGAPRTPFFLYHIPSKTNVMYKASDFLSAAAARTTIDSTFFPTLAGVKFTDGDMEDFLYCTNLERPAAAMRFGSSGSSSGSSGSSGGGGGAAGGKYNMLYGSDQQFTAGLALGADGGVGTSYNWNAATFRAIAAAVAAGDLVAARAAQLATNELMSDISSAEKLWQPDAYAWKAFFNLVSDAGVDAGMPRLPYTLPNAKLVAALGAVAKSWCAKYRGAAFSPGWCRRF